MLWVFHVYYYDFNIVYTIDHQLLMERIIGLDRVHEIDVIPTLRSDIFL